MSAEFEFKRLHQEAIPAALEKAYRYRLLHEPAQAESICHDVLLIDPDNQQALVTLVLALTDRFDRSYAVGVTQAREVLPRLHSEYDRAYYSGIISERRAKAQLRDDNPGSSHDAYEYLREAMDWYEKAEAMRPQDNDDAILRWNTCARIIMGNKLTPRLEPVIDLQSE
jgi:tetratricopeptide (TPR) repeat protein